MATSGTGAIRIPDDVTGMRLYRINSRRELIGCERAHFRDGALAVNTVLRRAQISGRVEVGGDIGDHFADLLNDRDEIVESVALDRGSYSALKNHWMRCRVSR